MTRVAEPEVVLREPLRLGLQRASEPSELLVGGEVALADDGWRRDGEVDRPEKALVELCLISGEYVRRRSREPDEVDVAEFFDGRADDVAPERGEVMAVVEDDRLDAVRAQRVEPLASARCKEVTEAESTMLGPGDFALDRGFDAAQLALAPGSGLPRPACRFALDLLTRLAGCLSSLDRPPPSREIAESDARIVELAERLVGEDRDRSGRVDPRDAGLVGELPEGQKPLALYGRIGNEDKSRISETADNLDA